MSCVRRLPPSAAKLLRLVSRHLHRLDTLPVGSIAASTAASVRRSSSIPYTFQDRFRDDGSILENMIVLEAARLLGIMFNIFLPKTGDGHVQTQEDGDEGMKEWSCTLIGRISTIVATFLRSLRSCFATTTRT